MFQTGMFQTSRPWRSVATLALPLCLALWTSGAQGATATTKRCADLRPVSEQTAARQAGLCTGPTTVELRAAAAAAAATTPGTVPATRAPFACQPLPDFVARASTFAQAEAALPKALFTARITSSQASSAPQNTILAQSTQTIEGRKCWANFVVSDGSMVRVPALIGLVRDDAIKAIVGRQLKPDLREFESEQPVGRVFRQSPSANAEVARGSAVLVQVAQPLTWPTPALVGLDITAALGRLGPFKARQVAAASLKRAGEVIAQTPAAGERRERGAELLLTVSDGTLVEVPKLVGRRIEAAQTLLAKAGLQLQRHDRADGAAPGLVLDQSPAGGQAVARDSAVSLQVSGGLVLPDVVGQPATAAKGLLQRFKVVTQVEASEAPADEVMGQSPAAGTHVAAATKVVLRLSDASIVTVPPTVGLTLPQARDGLQRAGSLIAVVGADRDRSKAVVEASDPPPGSKVRRGSGVALTVKLPTPWWAWLGGGAGVIAAGAAVMGLARRKPSAIVAAAPVPVPATVPVPAPATIPSTTPSTSPTLTSAPDGPGVAPVVAVSASLQFNTAPISVRPGDITLPTIRMHATLQQGDAQIHCVKEPSP